eukprot:CAMPEP_0168319456 /NCGR_PEP_ID=MMETSP0213-20121227/1066_1 /TAXON_ID=151035 /ORGANISM="Euplotes harpa, Strain FSP1.4" /LENGTH=66 /DNA_ID=CAMNT_0008320679 /DNA_START=616 /DNA_END=816 /DNA_ORIENTATION=+
MEHILREGPKVSLTAVHSAKVDVLPDAVPFITFELAFIHVGVGIPHDPEALLEIVGELPEVLLVSH